MKKREYLVPLGVSVAALLGGAVVPTQASTNPTNVSVGTAPGSFAMGADHLVLTRRTGGELRLADHSSHASHASHASHGSGS
jgi:hypothetical protein